MLSAANSAIWSMKIIGVLRWNNKANGDMSAGSTPRFTGRGFTIDGIMPALIRRPQKITFGEVRDGRTE